MFQLTGYKSTAVVNATLTNKVEKDKIATFVIDGKSVSYEYEGDMSMPLLTVVTIDTEGKQLTTAKKKREARQSKEPVGSGCSAKLKY